MLRLDHSERLHRRMTSRFMACLLILFLFECTKEIPLVQGDWIDPDTPWEVRTIQPYVFHPPQLKTPKPPPLPSEPANATSFTPSLPPSVQPSCIPTNEPTPYPTPVPENYRLVFSDEFNTPYRTLEDGVDPRWTALDKNDYTNDALHYYSPLNAVTSYDGNLVITSEAVDTTVVGFDDVKLKKTIVTKHFRSAMIQSWNKFCFTGGIVETQVTLPGLHNVGGLWPAFWLLGNLARHTYVGSANNVWPWSDHACTEQTKNGAQLISGCNRAAHYGLQPEYGRGAPEIDILEAQPGNIKANTGPFLRTTVGQPFVSTSFQVAPGRPANRPGSGFWPGPKQWYDGLVGGRNSSLNINFYGTYNHFGLSSDPNAKDYWSDAISYNSRLNESFFNSPHIFRLEWDVPTEANDGYLRWYIDGDLALAINGTGIREAGLGSEISSEPSYILMNTAISKQWGFPQECPPNCPCDVYDCHSTSWGETCGFSEGFCDMLKDKNNVVEYKINWVRVYQDPSNPVQKVGCSTPERPTRRYIEAHRHLYKSEHDAQPLKSIQHGQGSCDPKAVGVLPDACGGNERGRCTASHTCECLSGWTGPHCLAHAASDPILYDVPETIADVGFFMPINPPQILLVATVALAFIFLFMMRFRRRLEGWTPLPDVIEK